MQPIDGTVQGWNQRQRSFLQTLLNRLQGGGGEGSDAELFGGADAAEAELGGLPPTTDDADDEAEAAEVISEDELMESGDEEDDVQVRVMDVATQSAVFRVYSIDIPRFLAPSYEEA